MTNAALAKSGSDLNASENGSEIAGHEFLAFTLGSEEYGIDISLVNKPFFGYNITPPIIKGFKNGKLFLI